MRLTEHLVVSDKPQTGATALDKVIPQGWTIRHGIPRDTCRRLVNVVYAQISDEVEARELVCMLLQEHQPR